MAELVTLHPGQENAQALRSKRALVTALYQLMARDNYHDLTITQICQEADVTRQTFYRHFQTKQNVLAYDFQASFQAHVARYPDQGIQANLNHIFQDPPVNRDKLRLLKRHSLFFLLGEHMVDFLKKHTWQYAFTPLLGTERYQTYQEHFIAATLLTLLSCWTNNDFVETPEELTALALCMLGGV